MVFSDVTLMFHFNFVSRTLRSALLLKVKEAKPNVITSDVSWLRTFIRTLEGLL